jgi:hypothetical protein
MLPTILFLISQSETTESSQPTRILAVFLAPRNLSVSWPSVFVTPRTTKHKENHHKKYIFQRFHNLSACSNLSIPFLTNSSPYLSSFHKPFPDSLQPPSLLSINLPYLDFWEKIKIKLKYK